MAFMPSSPDQPYAWSYQQLGKVLRIIGDWEPQDREAFLEGKVDDFSIDGLYRNMDSAVVDPYEWVKAIEHEKQERRDYYSRLVTEHGHPDTSCMSRERGYIVRLSFLMAKYPNSDWDMLLADPVSARKQPATESKPNRPAAIVRKQVPEELPKPVAQVASEDETTAATENETSGRASADENTAPLPLNMDVKEVAKVIGMTEQTVRRFMAEGALPYAKKLRRNWVVPREPFMEWFKGNDDAVRALSEPKPRPKRTPKEPEPTRVHRHGRSASF